MKVKAFIQRHAVVLYFGLVLLISYGSFAVLDGPKLLQGKTPPPGDAEFILFPIIVLSVCLLGLIFTAIVNGRSGLRDLFSRIGHWRAGVQWYVPALLLPPVLLLAVLLVFRSLVSPVFTPKVFLFGIVFGLPGFLEEFGWIGYVFPQMQKRYSNLAAALMLGVLWGLWHAPVVDYLGAAAPHGVYWAPFFLDFVALVTALRVLMVWIYSHTRSILLVQLMHLSFVASLVVFDPTTVSPAQEALWYAVYAAVLWIVVALVVARYGKQLARRPGEAGATEVVESSPAPGEAAHLDERA